MSTLQEHVASNLPTAIAVVTLIWQASGWKKSLDLKIDGLQKDFKAAEKSAEESREKTNKSLSDLSASQRADHDLLTEVRAKCSERHSSVSRLKAVPANGAGE